MALADPTRTRVIKQTREPAEARAIRELLERHDIDPWVAAVKPRTGFKVWVILTRPEDESLARCLIDRIAHRLDSDNDPSIPDPSIPRQIDY